MNVLQCPETSTPSISNCSCVTRFSGRISDFSWIGIDAPSRTQLARFAEHVGFAVDQLEAGATGLGVDGVEPEHPARVRHSVGLGTAAEIRVQILAAPVVDVAGVDVGTEQVGIECKVAENAVRLQKTFQFLAQHREGGKAIAYLNRSRLDSAIAVPDFAQHTGID